MVDARLQRNIHILRDLHKSRGANRKRMLQNLGDDTVDALSDCACNIRNGNVPLTTHQFRALKPYHKHLKQLSKKSLSRKSRRKTLMKGGFIGFLLKPLVKVLLGGM